MKTKSNLKAGIIIILNKPAPPPAPAIIVGL
jgi:hypothetical protein